MSSDSDDHSITSAAKVRRFRERQRAGVAPRHMATPDKQQHLFTLPNKSHVFEIIVVVIVINNSNNEQSSKILQTKMKLNIKVIDKHDNHITYCKDCLYRQD